VASTLRPGTVDARADSLITFRVPGSPPPRNPRPDPAHREHVEGFLDYNHGRPWRGRVARDQPVSQALSKRTVIDLRCFLDDITLWGWVDRPPARMLFSADIPRLDRPLPRALAPDADRDLMDAIARLDDPFARIGMTLLRGTGLRLGELLDLELDWLNSEMLKTWVAHGYCSRQLAAEACPYANICEQCDNFVTAPEFIPALQAQLTDAATLRDDSTERGWHTEVARHSRVITSIQKHLDRLTRQAGKDQNA
jgi:hypothetical protein